MFGGVTSESEISVITTCAVYKYLKQLPEYTIIPLYISQSGEWYSLPEFDGSIAHFMSYKFPELTPLTVKPGREHGLQIISKGSWAKSDTIISLDLLFPILHGVGGEDGSIQ